jgi:hypothetical protein
MRHCGARAIDDRHCVIDAATQAFSGKGMKRRKLLTLVSAAAVATLSSPLLAASKCLDAAKSGPESGKGGVCALIPVSASCAQKADRSTRLIAIDTFWENETQAALSRLALMLSIRHAASVRTVQLWQLRRDGLLPLIASNALSMLFGRGAELSLDARLGGFDGRGESQWTASLGVDASYLLLTPRALTGAPPATDELQFDPLQGTLRLRNGAPRDFDALLIHT